MLVIINLMEIITFIFIQLYRINNLYYQTNIKSMSNYRKIADQFSRFGCKQTTRFREHQINNVLDKIVQNNINLSEFNRDVAQELFQQTDKDADNSVILRDYINTILAAHSVLDKHIKECQRNLDQAHDQNQKRQLIQNIQQFQQDYQLLTKPFHLGAPRSSQLPSSPLNNSGLHRSHIFAQQPSSRQESGSLKLVLILTLCSFLLDLICVFVRHHFLNSLCYLLVLSIFFLNYFDKYTIRVSIVALSISLILDIVWLITQVDPYWNSNGQTQHSTLQPGFLKAVFIFTIILLFAKVLIGILLYRFRNNDETIRKSVRFLNLRFELNGSSQGIRNPIESLFVPPRDNLVYS